MSNNKNYFSYKNLVSMIKIYTMLSKKITHYLWNTHVFNLYKLNFTKKLN